MQHRSTVHRNSFWFLPSLRPWRCISLIQICMSRKCSLRWHTMCYLSKIYPIISNRQSYSEVQTGPWNYCTHAERCKSSTFRSSQKWRDFLLVRKSLDSNSNGHASYFIIISLPRLYCLQATIDRFIKLQCITQWSYPNYLLVLLYAMYALWL